MPENPQKPLINGEESSKLSKNPCQDLINLQTMPKESNLSPFGLANAREPSGTPRIPKDPEDPSNLNRYVKSNKRPIINNASAVKF